MSTVHPTYYFSIEDGVTNMGLRLAIAQDIPDELQLRVDNISDRKVKVYLRGNETAIKRFYEHITKKKTLGKAQKFTISELKPIDGIGCFDIETDRFFHKLQCEQMGKFVDVGIEMKNEISTMGGKIDGLGSKIDQLPKRIAEELKEALRP